ncbi:MAG: bifunctional diaminohydroxyphosphoribosylaminopyrimidine deaminase/5-amino-6-(5-phosphoribosylamino)uracil reductase RibD [Bacteroidales bacterium]|nr:bifunctional diaminohydroxyphosphoribosylaminopyrimidine deaminase/5-amino-6-(5-phosphoribosylamino)uracil reductase RibD [Bacteroidales bacterium]
MTDENYMRRCFQLAQNGLGRTSPNPLVGCVIVKKGRIVAEGYHQEIGQWHAERNAILHCSDKSDLQEATLYVNLEPCAHQGLTPPCAPLVAQSGIRRVVVCNDDPNPLVHGRGYDILRQAGVEVTTHVLEQEGRFLNRRFFTFMEQGRPYVILKWARTADGFMDVDRDDGKPHPYWISSPEAKQMSHSWRTEESAILVGSQTFLNDRPQLTARLWKGNQPQRFVLDRRGRVRVSEAEDITPIASPDIPSVLEFLYGRKIQSVIVEGGRTLLDAFLSAGLYDEIRVFSSPVLFGKGLRAPSIPPRPATLVEERIGGDDLMTLLYA